MILNRCLLLTQHGKELIKIIEKEIVRSLARQYQQIIPKKFSQPTFPKLFESLAQHRKLTQVMQVLTVKKRKSQTRRMKNGKQKY